MTDMDEEDLLAIFQRMQRNFLAHNMEADHVTRYAETQAFEEVCFAIEALETLLDTYGHTDDDDETLQVEIEDFEDKLETLEELYEEDPYSPDPALSEAVTNALEAASQSAMELEAAYRVFYEQRKNKLENEEKKEDKTTPSVTELSPTYEHPNPFSSKEWKTLHKYGGLMTQSTSGPYTETINIEQAEKLHERIFGALISLPTSYEVDPKGATPLEYDQHLITWISYLTELHRAFGFHLTTREDCEMANLLSTAPRGPLGTSIIPDIYPISREILSLYETMSLNLSSIIYPHKKLTSSLLNALKKERSKLAKKEGIPPYLIFHNVALEAMAIELPASMEELLELPHVGPKNSEKYGRLFLSKISPYSMALSHPEAEYLRYHHSPFSGARNFTLLENKHFSDHPAGQDLGLTNSLLLIPPLQEFHLKKRSSSDGDGPSPTYSRKIEDMELLRVFSQGVPGLWGEAIALFNLGVLSWSGARHTNNPVDLLQESLSKFRELNLERGRTESSGSFGFGMRQDIKRDEWKTLEELINVLQYRKFEGDLEWAEELSKEKDAIGVTFDLDYNFHNIKPPGYYSRKGSEVLSSEFDPRTSRFPTHRLGGISDEETPTVYFELLDRVVAEFDHNAPDALTNLESQLNEISLPDDSSLQSLPLSEIFSKLDRSNLIRVNLVLETRDGYLICREFENSLSIIDSRSLPDTDSQLLEEVERGDINWSFWDLGEIALKLSSYPYRCNKQKSESLGLIADIEAGLSCNHFSRTTLNHSVDELVFDPSLACGFRAYYIGLDTATRQINLCHLIDHLFDRRIADNKLLTALHLLLLETELRPEAETSQQEANPLDRPIKALKYNPASGRIQLQPWKPEGLSRQPWKPTRTRF